MPEIVFNPEAITKEFNAIMGRLNTKWKIQSIEIGDTAITGRVSLEHESEVSRFSVVKEYPESDEDAAYFIYQYAWKRVMINQVADEDCPERCSVCDNKMRPAETQTNTFWCDSCEEYSWLKL